MDQIHLDSYSNNNLVNLDNIMLGGYLMAEIRLIDADELKKVIAEFHQKQKDQLHNPLWSSIGVNNLYDLIDNAQTIPQTIVTEFKGCDNCELERPKGNWIKWNFKTFGAMGDWEYKCDHCGKVYGGEHNFCPNCGADMQKGGTPNV